MRRRPSPDIQTQGKLHAFGLVCRIAATTLPHALPAYLTAPSAGGNLPIVLLSHGYGPSNYIPSKDGYAHLAQFWAERGFAFIQPTHASSRVGGLLADASGAPFFWRDRVEEMRSIVDRLAEVERQAPAIASRLDYQKIAAAGHSFGGHIAVASDWMSAPQLADGTVQRVLEDWQLPPIDRSLVFPTGRLASTKARAFADFAGSVVAAQCT